MKLINNRIRLLFRLFLIFMLISCREQEKKDNNIKSIKEVKIPDFLSQKYFHGYQLSPNSDFPIYMHTDNSIGEFTVNFLNKNTEKQKEWFDFDAKNNVFSEDEQDDNYFKQINLLIKKRLENNLSEYNMITEYIPKKFFTKKNEYKYPYKKYFYLYVSSNKSWKLINTKTVKNVNENITSLQNFNSLIKNLTTKIQPLQTNTSQISNWKGVYHVDIDYGKLDKFSEISINYSIEIKDSECTFSGMGYKTYFIDLCKIEPKNDTLVLKYLKTIDGDGFTNHSDIDVLGIITHKNNVYYLKSPIVGDLKWNYNTNLKLTKTK
ncbi:DUF5991 domain-containing protein [Chryseobacterium wangxinyae]|uniref:DUF5991 domain-containing protein n=1 Tax=Chryseobacterium sp. CY350 TaxID=2997336 RepID=UPI0022717B47|nr:DUF5991 domain-containing protein [Chryseobacterium sp. CY350]MCY0978694.1 DUF5991 domain-containing protein [Chryseobacterium sp. CY350]WBZ93925.1 DUF5991 domain-containing protein [Chryseobacterium sp. CY350]